MAIFPIADRTIAFFVPAKLQQVDEVAEWLRRWTANPMCSARVGSNPILVEILFYFSQLFSLLKYYANISRDSSPTSLTGLMSQLYHTGCL